MVLWGADRLTEGASALARRMNVPEIVIGLTIVAAGTSAPELFVSLVSALKGTSDLAVGNVVGSNSINSMLIVGVTAMVAPISVSRNTVKKDIPFSVLAGALLFVVCMDTWQSLDISGNFISRLDGILLLATFAVFMYYTFAVATKGAPGLAVPIPPYPNSQPLWRDIVFVLLGLGCLIVGSNLFVDSASSVAAQLGVSESLIGLTIVAGGTSLPELATSVVAAYKGRSGIAIGNVIGSNVFNILLILGLTATISPMQIHDIASSDIGIMLASIMMVWGFSFTKYTVERWEGAVLVFGYILYFCALLCKI